MSEINVEKPSFYYLNDPLAKNILNHKNLIVLHNRNVRKVLGILM